ncbi:MAG: hypothetical protein A2029_15940 [Chloroflexi bacterium RBG_19FT_COMBO_47_9]|nr:MAG: hypothetical protein A2029_15940 [Chloroflexi bacterium RBG_19FT_COMBO_47_9]
MVDLPKKKVGIVACSGEELAEGTVTRLAALKVLEQLRPADTVTICLPLFLAGGEGDRAFARFYPTIAVDGCNLRCAAKGTEMYSGKPAVSLVVSDLVQQKGLEQPKGLRRLNESGKQAVDLMAEQIADEVDQILGLQWDRRKGEFASTGQRDDASAPSIQESVQATCSCGSGIPIQKVIINGQSVTLIALPVMLQQFKEAGKAPGTETVAELLDLLKIYNPIQAEEEQVYRDMLQKEYSAYFDKEPSR